MYVRKIIKEKEAIYFRSVCMGGKGEIIKELREGEREGCCNTYV